MQPLREELRPQNTPILGCSNHRLYCLSASTGAILWSFLAGDALKCTPAVIPAPSRSSGSLDRLIFPAYDRKLYCLRDMSPRPPEKLWECGLLESLCLAKPQGGVSVHMYLALKSSME